MYAGSDTAESAALYTKEFASAEAAVTTWDAGEGSVDEGGKSAGSAVSFLVSSCYGGRC